MLWQLEITSGLKAGQSQALEVIWLLLEQQQCLKVITIKLMVKKLGLQEQHTLTGPSAYSEQI